MSIETMFLVLSDLHFGPDLYEPPEMALLSLSGMLGWVAKDTTVRNAFVKQCAGHDIACVKKLPFYLRFLISEAKNQGFERDTFDLCLLLGDQVTIPDARSYKFLRQYLTQQEYSTSDGYVDYRCSGLGLMGQQILAIPGNHDKLLRTNLDIYDREFNTRSNCLSASRRKVANLLFANLTIVSSCSFSSMLGGMRPRTSGLMVQVASIWRPEKLLRVWPCKSEKSSPL